MAGAPTGGIRADSSTEQLSCTNCPEEVPVIFLLHASKLSIGPGPPNYCGAEPLSLTMKSQTHDTKRTAKLFEALLRGAGRTEPGCQVAEAGPRADAPDSGRAPEVPDGREAHQGGHRPVQRPGR